MTHCFNNYSLSRGRMGQTDAMTNFKQSWHKYLVYWNRSQVNGMLKNNYCKWCKIKNVKGEKKGNT